MLMLAFSACVQSDVREAALAESLDSSSCASSVCGRQVGMRACRGLGREQHWPPRHEGVFKVIEWYNVAKGRSRGDR